MQNRAPGNGDISSDRISKLPEPILHHILCFLDQKRAIQTCVLSKSWRHLWCTRPKLEFSDGYTSVPEKTAAFLSVVDRALQAYHDRNLRLRELTLGLSDGGGKAALLLNTWIPILMHNMGVNKFSLYLCSMRPAPFELPSVVFESQSLRNLILRGCILKSTPAHVYSKHLLRLCVTHVYILDQVLDNVLSNCPSIEHVSLSDCTGFTSIEGLNNSKPTNLKNFSFLDHRKDGVSIGIGDYFQTLRTVEIKYCWLSFNRDRPLLNADHLARLCLEGVRFLSDSFSCNFPCLDELCLVNCSGIKEFNMSSPSMKRLDIKEPCRQFRANIDAPSIVSFRYEGHASQFISFAETTSNDWKSNIILKCAHSFDELNGLLKALSQSEISLVLNPSPIYWTQNEELPAVVEHLTIGKPRQISQPSSANFLNNLFRMFRPSFVYMDLLTESKNEHHQGAEFLLAERKMEQCYFWQRALEGVNLQVCYWGKKEWLHVESSRFPEFSKSGAAGVPRLQLRWREFA